MYVFNTKYDDGSVVPAVAFTTANPELDIGNILVIPYYDDGTYDIGLAGAETTQRDYWWCCEKIPVDNDECVDGFNDYVITKILSEGIIYEGTTYITLYNVMALVTLAYAPTEKYRLKFDIPQLTEREVFPDGWIPQDTFDLYFDGKVFYNSGFYEQYEEGSLKYTYNPYTKSRSDQTNIGDFNINDMDIIAVYDEKQEILYIEYDDD